MKGTVLDQESRPVLEMLLSCERSRSATIVTSALFATGDRQLVGGAGVESMGADRLVQPPTSSDRAAPSRQRSSRKVRASVEQSASSALALFTCPGTEWPFCQPAAQRQPSPSAAHARAGLVPSHPPPRAPLTSQRRTSASHVVALRVSCGMPLASRLPVAM